MPSALQREGGHGLADAPAAVLRDDDRRVDQEVGVRGLHVQGGWVVHEPRAVLAALRLGEARARADTGRRVETPRARREAGEAPGLPVDPVDGPAIDVAVARDARALVDAHRRDPAEADVVAPVAEGDEGWELLDQRTEPS